MKEFQLEDLLQFLSAHEAEAKLAAVAALVIVLLLGVYLIVRLRRGPAERPSEPVVAQPAARAPAPRPVVEETPAPAPSPRPVVERAPEPAPSPRPVVERAPEPAPVQPKPAAPAPAPKPSPSVAAKQPSRGPSAKPPAIPQESVLRRHYVTHVRTMVETVNAPRPTESVLRRHYEQLISSQVEDCLQDEAKMQKLLDRYDEHRRATVRRLAA